MVSLLVMTPSAAHAFAITARHKNKPCVVSDLNFDSCTDLEIQDEQEDTVAALLEQEKFKDLDCLADAPRSGKTNFRAGM